MHLEEENLAIIRKTLKNIKDSEVELFLHFNPDIAVQIVSDLVEDTRAVGRNLSAVDKETKHFAQRIKNCPNYKMYKAAFGQNK